MKVIKLAAVALTLVLAACAQEQDSTTAANEVASRDLQPADAQLAEIYNRSCRSCHTVAATGSPLTGDTAAWQPRMGKGMNTLLDSVVNGFGGMPPFGLCMDCGAEEFEALILFMAGEQK
ncbi:cytochrome c5 family protein [Halioglobus maricola]|uniref:Cytochrome c5 family protein n=1 Tax=Halioglobus maricola TaxID=2601894 RepID=A0A5P9NIK1_9GAMM|nr:c-type cytochrome [Halioglobus maricola]QFU75647.1 cytochrome c5 family protein [Halioglobus maricola]